MGPSNPITAAIFSAFLKCPTKAYLLAIGEHTSGTYFGDIQERIASFYKAAAKRRPRVRADDAEAINFGELWRSPNYSTVTHEVDWETAVYNLMLPERKPRGRRGSFIPVLFSPWDKLRLPDKLLVCFGALSLLQATGILAGTGTLIYGDG